MTADLLVTLGWGALVSLVLMLFVLGAAPVFTVRLIGLLYPRGHLRRAELLAEMKHVRGAAKFPEQWLWLGEVFATAICDGVPERLHARRRAHADDWPGKLAGFEYGEGDRLIRGRVIRRMGSPVRLRLVIGEGVLARRIDMSVATESGDFTDEDLDDFIDSYNPWVGDMASSWWEEDD